MDSAHAVAPSPQSLFRQRSCTELPRFADADAEERKISRSSGKGGHAFGRSMRFLPSSKPASVTLTPGRIVPSDLRRLVGSSMDARADVPSSGSECSDASRGSSARSTIPKPPSPLIARASSVRLLGSSNTQWALSPGRRSSSPVKALATVQESKGKKSLLSMGWGHLFNRRKTMDTDSSIATTTLANALPVSRGNGGIGEAGHQMRMMHCRFLQWRLLNAKADAASKNKRAIAEVQLMGAWASISELRGKVARKRVQLDKENLKIKLTNVLSSQMRGLDIWGQMESKHTLALNSTLDCAKAAVCRIPLTNGAKVSLPAMASILEQMFELAMTARISVRSFSPVAKDTAVLVSELVHVAREEQALLQDCLDLLGRVSALQIEEQSLRCHMVQSSSSLNLVPVWFSRIYVILGHKYDIIPRTLLDLKERANCSI
ncbi:QWRF motif-containing protein 3 [Lolium rigidum]|uniref:QWRF motif-containing protein 3 n=1 Tax=Lolium rigidum TaxID=89674 RepID=UPI001F5DBE0E|nr:QWRF motif-containing protein 3 [Lolium rigidum]